MWRAHLQAAPRGRHQPHRCAHLQLAQDHVGRAPWSRHHHPRAPPVLRLRSLLPFSPRPACFQRGESLKGMSQQCSATENACADSSSSAELPLRMRSIGSRSARVSGALCLGSLGLCVQTRVWRVLAGLARRLQGLSIATGKRSRASSSSRTWMPSPRRMS